MHQRLVLIASRHMALERLVDRRAARPRSLPLLGILAANHKLVILPINRRMRHRKNFPRPQAPKSPRNKPSLKPRRPIMLEERLHLSHREDRQASPLVLLRRRIRKRTKRNNLPHRRRCKKISAHRKNIESPASRQRQFIHPPPHLLCIQVLRPLCSMSCREFEQAPFELTQRDWLHLQRLFGEKSRNEMPLHLPCLRFRWNCPWVSQRKNKLRMCLVRVRLVLKKHPPPLPSIHVFRNINHPPSQLAVKPRNKSF